LIHFSAEYYRKFLTVQIKSNYKFSTVVLNHTLNAKQNGSIDFWLSEKALSTLSCQVHNQDANIASGIMGASIDKACLCPSFLNTRFARICGMFGFHG
jgi:hypothetical protein